MKLFSNVRFYILSISVSFSITIYLLLGLLVGEGQLKTIRLTQLFALTATAYLYTALLIGPATKVITTLPFKSNLVYARRAIGVSAFYFAALHGGFAFFGQLGGLTGLSFLTTRYLQAISLSFIALIILSVMVATSFDFMVSKLTYAKWKALHRLVYVAALLILVHALMLGTHFQDLSSLIPRIFAAALVLLLILEGLAFDKYLSAKYKISPKFGLGFIAALLFLAPIIYFAYGPKSEIAPGFNIHQEHIQIAQQNQNPQNTSGLNIPGLVGDRTKRYTVSFYKPDTISPGVETKFGFEIFDAASGNPVLIFNRPYEKTMHLIVVDSELKYFNHIHPDQIDSRFQIPITFPKAGKYHLYVDFQPLGAIEQQMAFTLDVGQTDPLKATQEVDKQFEKNVNNYQIKLSGADKLVASEASIGNQRLTFTISDSAGNPVTNLKPYLASFGHLVMINRDTYEYLHVHPASLVAPKPDEDGGPDVEFLPIGLYGPIKPGVYRAFAQLNPAGNLITADFTLEIK